MLAWLLIVSLSTVDAPYGVGGASMAGIDFHRPHWDDWMARKAEPTGGRLRRDAVYTFEQVT